MTSSNTSCRAWSAARRSDRTSRNGARSSLRETSPWRGASRSGHHQAAEDIALRSELARVLSRGDFPADRDTLLGRLSEADAPAGLVARLARVTADRPFASAHEVMVALGINEPERRPR